MTFSSKNGATIVVPNTTINHLKPHADVWDVLGDAISMSTFEKGFEMIEVDFGRVIGKSGALSTERVLDNEKTLWAKRIGRDTYSRVVIGEKEDCNTVMVLAYRNDDDSYTLITAFIGGHAEKEFTDVNLQDDEIEKSLNFWREYALVWEEGIFGEIIEATFEEARPDYYSDLLKIVGLDKDTDDSVNSADTLYLERIKDKQKISLKMTYVEEGVYDGINHNPREAHLYMFELDEFPKMEYLFDEKKFESDVKSIEEREILLPDDFEDDEMLIINNEVFDFTHNGCDNYEPRGRYGIDDNYFIPNK